jgi:tetratricopeptide (TPR) repeat protein
LFEETLKRSKVKPGPEHPDTLTIMNNLGRAYEDAGRLSDAQVLFEATLKARQAKLGSNHPLTRESFAILAINYIAAGQTEKGTRLLHDALAADRRLLGVDHPRLASRLAVVGNELVRRRIYSEAEAVLREALKIQEAQLPADWNTSYTKILLGSSLLGQQREAEAELLCVQGYEGMKSQKKAISTQTKARLHEALTRLVQLYDACGKKDQADRWRKQQAELARTPMTK